MSDHTPDNDAIATALRAIADLARSDRISIDAVPTLDGTDPRCRIRVDTLTGHLESILPGMTGVRTEQWRGAEGWLYRDHIGYLLTWKITVQELYGSETTAPGECSRPATTRVEGFRPASAADPVGSLDMAAYACNDSGCLAAVMAQITQRGLSPWRSPGPVTTAVRCGKVTDYAAQLSATRRQLAELETAPYATVRGVAQVTTNGYPVQCPPGCRCHGPVRHAADEWDPAGDDETPAPSMAPKPYGPGLRQTVPAPVPARVIRAIAHVSGAGAVTREDAVQALRSWDSSPDLSSEDVAAVLTVFPAQREVA